ncbi:MAG: GNAT family N-acetyltransferase [Spirochaetaceae bacterium]|nr:GNAT family N-acetyltransferase [Spirochaetaceae bacterium]
MSGIEIREAVRADAPRLAALAAQLGYPCDEAFVRERMGRYLGASDRVILVADSGGQAVAWTSMEVVDHFYTETCVELSGFVVDEELRGRGVGAALMSAAEAWARGGGHRLLRLRTNVIRAGARLFYERLGFENAKEQIVYSKRVR